MRKPTAAKRAATEIKLERVTITSPWTESQRREFHDIQHILLNMFPGMDMVEILYLNHNQRRASGAHKLFKRLKQLMSMKNTVTREPL